jgi:hypothetical protein
MRSIKKIMSCRDPKYYKIGLWYKVFLVSDMSKFWIFKYDGEKDFGYGNVIRHVGLCYSVEVTGVFSYGEYNSTQSLCYFSEVYYVDNIDIDDKKIKLLDNGIWV